MDPLVTSSLISAGSNLLGGVFGGSKKSKVDPVEQFRALQGEANRYALDFATKIPKAQMYGWKEAGIHPLAGLGMASPGAPAVGTFGQDTGSSGRDWGQIMSDMGQGVSRAVAAYATREEREMARYSSALQLENQQLQNDRLRSEIALMHAPGSPPGLSGSGNDADARYPSQSHMPMGFGDTAPLFRIGRDENGNLIRVYNDDLGDNEVLQALTAFGYSVPDWIHGKLRPVRDWLRSNSLQRFFKKGGR